MKKKSNNTGCLILFGAFALILSLFLPKKEKNNATLQPYGQPTNTDTNTILKSSDLRINSIDSLNQTKNSSNKNVTSTKKKKKTKKSSKAKKRQSVSTNRNYGTKVYYQGPRGGCYYYSSSGKKVYVDRSLCN